MFKSRDLGSNFESIGKYLKDKDEMPKTGPERTDETQKKWKEFNDTRSFMEKLSDPGNSWAETVNYRSRDGEIELSPKKFAELTVALKGPSAETRQVAEAGQHRIESTAAQATTRVEQSEMGFFRAVKMGLKEAWRSYREPKVKQKEKTRLEALKAGLAEHVAAYAEDIRQKTQEKLRLEAQRVEIEAKLAAYAA